jgi:hypothetical protein
MGDEQHRSPCSTRVVSIGVGGDPISLNGPGARCAKITAPMAQPGNTSTTTKRARMLTVGARTPALLS